MATFFALTHAYPPTWRERSQGPCHIISKLCTCSTDGRDTAYRSGHVGSSMVVSWPRTSGTKAMPLQVCTRDAHSWYAVRMIACSPLQTDLQDSWHGCTHVGTSASASPCCASCRSASTSFGLATISASWMYDILPLVCGLT